MQNDAEAAAARAAASEIAGFMALASIEATLPSDQEIDQLAGALRPGTRVFLSALPKRPAARLVEASCRLRAAGLDPCPHLAVRNFEREEDLVAFVRACVEEAGVRAMLVIAGDRDRPAGPFCNSVELIERGLPHAIGIDEVTVAGYPDGHPRLCRQEVRQALLRKQRVLDGAAARLDVAAQFCFATDAIDAWLRELRADGFGGTVRIGIAGPANVQTLLRYAARCGVRTIGRTLLGQGMAVPRLIVEHSPERQVRDLAALRAAGDVGDIRPHFFSFGGFLRTAAWIAAVQSGRFDVAPAGTGFTVTPPA
ncbi:MAG: methylenetetrahydrofolate reductase [Alphaproteobacteria bacterium]|nr:methylenetetrahydrofolate reductase [Alphaproteobacteria bacterium]